MPVRTRKERYELEVIQGGWRAACMDDDEWSEWIARNPMGVADSSFADRPCSDCPLGFALEMRAIDRCNGTPHGTESDGDEEVEPMTVPTVDEPKVFAPLPSGKARPGSHWAEKRAAKAERVFATLRGTPSYDKAAQLLGMSRSALEGYVRQYRVDGTLPADVDELIRTRAQTAGRPRVDRAGKTRAEVRRAVAAEPAPKRPRIVGARPSPTVRPGVVMPCDGCAHAAVCSIKDGLASWAERLPAPVPPHDAIRVESIAVSCEHRLAVAS